MDIQISINDKASQYLQTRPAKFKKAQEVALFDIGQQGAGQAKVFAPKVTGNLARSITFDGTGNFPLLNPQRTQTSWDIVYDQITFGKGAPIDDTVFIGTNIIYARPVEDIRGYMAATYDWLLNGPVDKIWNREIDIALEA